MLALSNLNQPDQAKDGLLRSECTGIDSDNVYYPKSLEGVEGDELAYCLKGICRAWEISQSGKGVFFSNPINLDGAKHQEFYDFLLYFWIQTFNGLLRQHIHPIFKSITTSEEFIIGQADLIKFELDSFKSRPVFECTYNTLSYDAPYLRVIKDGYLDLMRSFAAKSIIGPEIMQQTGWGLQALKQVPKSKNPIENAFTVKSMINLDGSIHGMPNKLAPLNNIILFFTERLTQNSKGLSPNAGYMHGLLFNLNYLLEYVLRHSLRLQYSNYEPQLELFKKNRVNNIKVKRLVGKGTYKQMMPDCIGMFSALKNTLPKKIREFHEGKIYIFDAKHKFFWSSNKHTSMKRDDFYQLISYATTHNNPQGADGVYGLIGLQEEKTIVSDKNFDNRSYIDFGDQCKSAKVTIEFDSRKLDIVQIPIRFGQVLYDIGVANDEEIENIYARLGRELLAMSYTCHTGQIDNRILVV